MALRTLRDLQPRDRRVFVRVDFNVPIEEGAITDDTRITSTLPTINHLLEHGATVILASHLGRPKGKPKTEFSLAPVAGHLSRILGRNVTFAADCVGPDAAKAIDTTRGGVTLLENLRFHAGEEANDPQFARELAALCDVYVNDAFGAAHRAHASTVGMVPLVAESAAGFLMEKEVSYLGGALRHPERPFVAILGGAKVSDKLEVIQNLITKVDGIIIGGAMAYTFLAARGEPVGKSLVEHDLLETARELERHAAQRGLTFSLPVDHVVAPSIDENVPRETLSVSDHAIADRMGLDIGPRTITAFQDVIARAKTVVWNGPMGVFEIEPFAAGTIAVAQAVANVRGTTIIGGGDSVAAVTRAGVADRMTHISTGGGASLEFLGGRELPGVAVLTANN